MGVKVNYKQLKSFTKKVQDTLGKEQVDTFIESCAKELAARLLANVIERTHAGDYSKTIEVTAKRDSKKHKKGETYEKKVSTGKVGGTLKRGWTGEKQEDAASYVNSLNVTKTGDTVKIEIVNPVEYAPYVEYGHRKRNHKGWVAGEFMLTLSERELQAVTPKILENKLKKKLSEAFR